jgi:hypothetical protein
MNQAQKGHIEPTDWQMAYKATPAPSEAPAARTAAREDGLQARRNADSTEEQATYRRTKEIIHQYSLFKGLKS